MNKTMASVTIHESELAHRQIADQLREKILRGELPVGTKLPPTEALARQWRTHIRNAHTALVTLTKEGLLSRLPRQGTFVRARASRLTRVGIYVTQTACLDPVSRFGHEVMGALGVRLNRFDIQHDLWMDPRPATEYGTAWTDFTLAIRRQEMQGIIAATVTLELRKWLDDLPLPVAYLGDELPTSVGLDWRQYLELSLRRLKEQGCQSVGWITSATTARTNDFEHFMDLTKDLGLRIRDGWIRVPQGDLASREFEPHGYEQFRALWRQTERPDGLLVDDDVMGRGVITAILAQRISVPAELKVVFHGNVEIPLVCPFPASFAEVVCGEVAEALVQQVSRRFRGEPCKMIWLPHRLTTR